MTGKSQGVYANGNTVGYLEKFSTDEYVHVEMQSVGTRTVAWSTERSCTEVLEMCASVLPSSPPAAEAYVSTNDADIKMSVQELMRILPLPVDVLFVTAQFPDISVAWSAPSLKQVDDTTPWAEMALQYPKHKEWDQDQILALAHLTGSAMVRHFIESDDGFVELLGGYQ